MGDHALHVVLGMTAMTGHFMHVPSTTSWSPSQTCSSSRVFIVFVNSVGALYMVIHSFDIQLLKVTERN